MKNFLGLKKLTSRELCTLGLLLALTLLMSMFFTARIGSAIKISTKFIPIAITSMLFGPLLGGLSAVLADLLSFVVNPVAAFMPQITLVEFLYGFTYGIFLRNLSRTKKGYTSGIICTLFQMIFLHIMLTSYFLMPIMNLGYKEMIIMRLPAAGVNFIIRIIGIILITSYSDFLRKLSGGRVKI